MLLSFLKSRCRMIVRSHIWIPLTYVKGSKLYRNAYVHSDHVAVMQAVSRHRDGRWVVSYDAVAPVLDIYSGFDPILYSLNYSAGTVGFGKEVIYLSDALSMPVIEGFAAAAAAVNGGVLLRRRSSGPKSNPRHSVRAAFLIESLRPPPLRIPLDVASLSPKIGGRVWQNGGTVIPGNVTG